MIKNILYNNSVSGFVDPDFNYASNYTFKLVSYCKKYNANYNSDENSISLNLNVKHGDVVLLHDSESDKYFLYQVSKYDITQSINEISNINYLGEINLADKLNLNSDENVISISGSDNILFALTNSNKIYIYDILNDKVLNTISNITIDAYKIAVSKDLSTIVLLHSDLNTFSTLNLFDLKTFSYDLDYNNSSVKIFGINDTYPEVKSIFLSESGSVIYVLTQDDVNTSEIFVIEKNTKTEKYDVSNISSYSFSTTQNEYIFMESLNSLDGSIFIRKYDNTFYVGEYLVDQTNIDDTLRINLKTLQSTINEFQINLSEDITDVYQFEKNVYLLTNNNSLKIYSSDNNFGYNTNININNYLGYLNITNVDYIIFNLPRFHLGDLYYMYDFYVHFEDKEFDTSTIYNNIQMFNEVDLNDGFINIDSGNVYKNTLSVNDIISHTLTSEGSRYNHEFLTLLTDGNTPGDIISQSLTLKQFYIDNSGKDLFFITETAANEYIVLRYRLLIPFLVPSLQYVESFKLTDFTDILSDITSQQRVYNVLFLHKKKYFCIVADNPDEDVETQLIYIFKKSNNTNSIISDYTFVKSFEIPSDGFTRNLVETQDKPGYVFAANSDSTVSIYYVDEYRIFYIKDLTYNVKNIFGCVDFNFKLAIESDYFRYWWFEKIYQALYLDVDSLYEFHGNINLIGTPNEISYCIHADVDTNTQRLFVKFMNFSRGLSLENYNEDTNIVKLYKKYMYEDIIDINVSDYNTVFYKVILFIDKFLPFTEKSFHKCASFKLNTMCLIDTEESNMTSKLSFNFNLA